MIDFCVELGFYVWFKSRGLNMAQARKAITFLGGGVLELFFDGTVPLWTLDVGLIIIFERIEEYVAKNADKLGKGSVVVQKYAQAKGNTQLARTAGGVKSFAEKAGQNQAALTKRGGSTKNILQERSENNAKKRLEKSNPSTKTQNNHDIIPRREEENVSKEVAPIREDPIFIEEERRKKAREDRISKLKDVRLTI